MKCIDCSFASFEADPDPHDWFCDDDMKIVCKAGKRPFTVASGLRPYEVKNVEAARICILRDK